MFKIFLAKQFFTYILAIATIFVLPLWPIVSAQNTGEIPEFIYNQSIEYPNSSLQAIWPDL